MENSSNISYEKLSPWLKWVAVFSGVSYGLGFLVLFFFQFDITSIPTFDFPYTKALIVGFGTVFVILSCHIVLLKEFISSDFVNPFASYKVTGSVSEYLSYGMFKGVELFADTLAALSFALILSFLYSTGEIQYLKLIFVPGVFAIIIIEMLLTIQNEKKYPKILLFIYLTIIIAFSSIVLKKIFSELPLSKWLPLVVIILARIPLASFIKAQKEMNISQIVKSLFLKDGQNNIIYLLGVLGFLNYYATNYYPLIRAEFGGGEAIPVQINMVTMDREQQFQTDTIMLSETNSDYIVSNGRSGALKIYRINKDHVNYLVRVD